jgi:hypothetical protein
MTVQAIYRGEVLPSKTAPAPKETALPKALSVAGNLNSVSLMK